MKSVLAACRRIFIALFAVLVLLGGWFYWQAPSLNELRPELESHLAGQLGLEELSLGNLSWRWAGHVWLKADKIAFVGAEKRIEVEDAQLEVGLSGWDLMRGEIRPTSISLRHGHIVLHIPKAASGEAFPLPGGVLRIEDSTVTLSYAGFNNRFEHLDLLLDADRRALGMQMPGFNLDVAWNTQLQPRYVHARFDNLHWLPEEWRTKLKGAFSAELQLDKDKGRNDWGVLVDISSDEGASLVLAGGRSTPPINAIHVKARAKTGASPLDISAIDWQELALSVDGNSLAAHGDWAEGVLHMQASAADVDMAKLASLARPFAEPSMHTWLAGLSGRVESMRADLRLKQPMPLSFPEAPDLKSGDVDFEASLTDGNFPLVTPGEDLEGYNGIVQLNADGLLFRASSMRLPLGAGVVHGTAQIRDFDHPMFDIKGKGEVELGRLEAWMQVSPLPQLRWKHAPAEGEFTLTWPMFAVAPESGEAQLQPHPVWQAELMGQAVDMQNGDLYWQAGSGVRFENMDVLYQGLKGNLDLAISEPKDGVVEVLSARLESNGDFQALADRFHMPIDKAAGHYALALRIAEKGNQSPWSLDMNLKDAAWGRLLGSDKKIGVPYALEASGKRAGDTLSIEHLRSRGDSMPFVSGSGKLSFSQAKIRITALQTPAFSGAISLMMPFTGDDALEIDIDSDFLDQAALPEKMPEMGKFSATPGKSSASSNKSKAQRKWVLRGLFKRIRWDAVSIRGVRINFASSSQGIGSLEADALDAAQLSIRDVRTFFRLAPGGHVGIRHLSARLLDQELNLSGVLRPEVGGGLRWTGFADINGDFSQVIHRLDASRLFKGGTVHALWSGSGVIREDKPWWNDMKGRLRLRVDDGRILEGGTMTKLLAALSLVDLPGFLTGSRKDITGPGMLYKRLQLESTVEGETANIRQLAMRASALDMAGKGQLNMADGMIDLYLTARPLQNIDAILSKIPLLRDVMLGPAKSLFRKIYHVHGPLHDAKVESVSAEQAGLPNSGLVEQLISLPSRWFDASRKVGQKEAPAIP